MDELSLEREAAQEALPLPGANDRPRDLLQRAIASAQPPYEVSRWADLGWVETIRDGSHHLREGSVSPSSLL